MRKRRAERCVLRAEAALDAGFDEEAQAALDEARRLDSATPDIDTLRRALMDRREAEAERRRRERRRSLTRSVAAAALIAALGVASVSVWPDTPTTAPDVPAMAPASNAESGNRAVVPSPVAPAARTAGAPPPSAQLTVSTSGVVLPAVRPEEPVAAGERSAAPARAESLESTAGPLPVPAPAPPPGVPLLERPPSTADETAAAIPSVAPPVVNAVSELPGSPAAIAPPPPRNEPAPEDDLPKVRGVLAQYEAAYSRLDAAAAQAVWPGVDGRSLARAFDSLESQRVSLGRCSISIDGSSAAAQCSGSATWTPRVGGGTRTEPRRWTFQLAATGGTWRIISAEAR